MNKIACSVAISGLATENVALIVRSEKIRQRYDATESDAQGVRWICFRHVSLLIIADEICKVKLAPAKGK